jgi:tRNA wybutosine-synthesizing protein 3
MSFTKKSMLESLFVKLQITLSYLQHEAALEHFCLSLSKFFPFHFIFLLNMNQEFVKRKEQVVSSLVEYLDPEKRDKSPKGFIDAPILDLMHVINQHQDYYTTSSCSGRVAIYCPSMQDDKTTTKGGIWLYVSHDPISVPSEDQEAWIVQLLFSGRPVVFDFKRPVDLLSKQLIYFKFEPLVRI